jgi:chloramphenicol-sensitive protein RarD
MWGLFPLYWPLLLPSSPLEILAGRFVWSFVFLVLLLTVTRAWSVMGPVLRSRRRMLLLLLAAMLVTVNWGTYIWAVNNEHVVESSLGYFINPLVSVLLGVVVLRESLRPMQWTAFGIAASAVVVLTVGYGRLPWIAFVLAFSFGMYGLVKKVAGVDAVPSLTVETSYLLPVGLVYLTWLQVNGSLQFGHVSPGHTVLMLLVGVATALPLLAFTASAIRIPLSMVGLLQYIAPVLQFLIGVLVFAEPMPPARWIGFAIVWVALAVFSVDAVRHSRAMRRVDHLEVAEPV